MTKVERLAPQKKSGAKLKLFLLYNAVSTGVKFFFGAKLWAWFVLAHPAKAMTVKAVFAPVGKTCSWIAGVAVGAFDFALATAA